MADDEEELARSVLFPRPWRVSADEFPSGYGRYSYAVIDAEGKAIVLLNPSQDEYAVACTEAAAEEIIKAANASHGES